MKTHKYPKPHNILTFGESMARRKHIRRAQKGLKKKMAFARKLDRFFDMRPELRFTEHVKEGDCDEKKNIIRINPKQPLHKFKEALTHEYLHLAWDLDHDRLARMCNYRSYGKKLDYFSRFMMRVVDNTL